ncbi:MAG: hypothetical protein NWF03_08360 [Candidatus Bathyarchaeota archaeon]|nr:hypothetical protein [Candidatus Bathyarchaeota archaeon]
MPNRSYRFDIRNKATHLWAQCMNMLDYFVNNDFRVCLFWSQGFILWVLGCYSVLVGAEISYTILGYLSLLFCGIALYLTYMKIKTI